MTAAGSAGVDHRPAPGRESGTAPGRESGTDELRSAIEHGRICALAAECQRDLRECVERYPELFPPGPFDQRLLSAVALANAFGSPWANAAQLRIALTTSMWNFAADWQLDYLAKRQEDVRQIIDACLAVADGGPPDAADGSTGRLTRFLAEIIAELSAVPAFALERDRWRGQLARWLAAMAREWEWKAARAATRGSSGNGTGPSFDEYLDNADNFGTTWVNLSHWIFVGDAGTFDHLDELWAASQQVQRVLRLLNDLATYHRDRDWGDLNALMLGVDRAEVRARIDLLVERCRELIEPLKSGCPRPAAYLERQIGFSTGFYGTTDYWGSLR